MLAGAWFVASQASSSSASQPRPDVCLCGEGRVGQCMVRQWVEFYVSRIRSETPWDAISSDQLKSVLEVREVSDLVRNFKKKNDYLSPPQLFIGTQ